MDSVLRRSNSCRLGELENLNTLAGYWMTYIENDLSEITSNFKMALGHLLTVRNDDGTSLSGEAVDDISSQETSSPEDGNSVSYPSSQSLLLPIHSTEFVPPRELLPPCFLIIVFPSRPN
jgi:hypothetical protein